MKKKVKVIGKKRLPERISWHNIDWLETIKTLKSDPNFGLTEKEAKSRQEKYGKNLIPEKKKTSEIFLFLKHFQSPLIYLIFIASVLSLFLHKFFDAAFILMVILITGVIAYFQERGASRILEELKKIIKIKAVVLREGRKKQINSEDLVKGDIIFLKSGDKVPADARLIESSNFQVNEMALTGEWLPSKKHWKILPKDTVLADRENMIYMGTLAEEGEAKAIVVNIGENTEMGKIALSLQKEKKSKTLLERKLASFSKHYGTFIFFLLVLIFIFGIFRKIPGIELLTIVIAAGISAVPEGLLPAVTIILIIGMKRILNKKGMVRKLSILETLGNIQMILSDKTATLTEGKMRVVKVLTGEEFLGKSPKNHNFALEVAALISEAFIENPEEAIKNWKIRGESTDRALLLAAVESGINTEELRAKMLKKEELPFTSDRKYHAVLFQNKNSRKKSLYVVGAPEKVLSLSKYLRTGRKEELLDSEKLDLISRNLENLAKKGFRVLGLAYKKIKSGQKTRNFEEEIENLVFLGILALKDPLRKGAKKAIETCLRMGIRPIIVSGDHLLTTKAIAEEVGLEVKKENIIEAKDLDKLSKKEFLEKLDKINVFARISPHHKLEIVDKWQEKGMVVAMTGDGINDAPALRRADVGLALGSGTELAKEASDLVLLDDNFSTIISAIEEGRGIFDKIRNITIYLVANDFTELGFVFISIIFGFPLPLLPTQILWINIIEDSFPSVALTLERREKEVLFEKPRPQKEDVLNRPTKIWMLAICLVTVITEIIFFLIYLRFGFSVEKARTFLFVATTLETFYLAFAHRSLRHIILRKDIFSNFHLNLSVVFGAFLLFLAVYFPIFQKFLHTVALNSLDWFLIIACVFIEAIILERIKKSLFIKKI